MADKEEESQDNLAIKNIENERVVVGGDIPSPASASAASSEAGDLERGKEQVPKFQDVIIEDKSTLPPQTGNGQEGIGGGLDSSLISLKMLGSMSSDLLILLITSLLVFLQAVTSCATTNTCPVAPSERNKGLVSYAVAAGLVSAILCAIMLLLTRFTTLPDKTRFYLSLFFLIWWTVAAGLLTFAGPYEFMTVSNGYFCTWGSFVISAYMTHNEVEPLKKAMDNATNQLTHSPEQTRHLYMLMASSLVVLLTAISPCTITCEGNNGLALGAPIASILVALILRFGKSRVAPFASKIAILLVLLWGITTAVVTFGGPFRNVGNGYFGCYASLIFSGLYLKNSLG